MRNGKNNSEAGKLGAIASNKKRQEQKQTYGSTTLSSYFLYLINK